MYGDNRPQDLPAGPLRGLERERGEVEMWRDAEPAESAWKDGEVEVGFPLLVWGLKGLYALERGLIDLLEKSPVS